MAWAAIRSTQSVARCLFSLLLKSFVLRALSVSFVSGPVFWPALAYGLGLAVPIGVPVLADIHFTLAA